MAWRSLPAGKRTHEVNGRHFWRVAEIKNRKTISKDADSPIAPGE
jgi:hypothetical protein